MSDIRCSVTTEAAPFLRETRRSSPRGTRARTRREDTVAPQRSRVRLSPVGKEGSAVDTRASYSHHAHRGPQREVAPGRLTSEHRAFPGFDSRLPPAGRAQGRAVRAAELPHEALAVAQRRAMVGNVRHPPRSRSRLPPGTPVAIRITRASYPFRRVPYPKINHTARDARVDFFRDSSTLQPASPLTPSRRPSLKHPQAHEIHPHASFDEPVGAGRHPPHDA